jgi:hypothetical protein
VKRTKAEQDNSTLKKSFVIYDPDNPPFERPHHCKYLLELPDLEEEDDPKTD